MQDHVRYDRGPWPHAARITLHRPEARNAYSIEMIDGLVAALDRAEDDPDVWVVVLAGAGPSFSAGGDLKAMAARAGMFAGDPVRLRTAYTRHIQRVPRRLQAFDKPVIARVHGAAIGAGLDLACMCDLRIASSRAKLGSTFVRLGLIPGDGGAYFLSRTIGYAAAARMVLTGEVIDAEEALRRGLVTEVVPADPTDAALDEAIGRWVATLCEAGPVALRLARQALVRSWDLPAEHALELAATYQGIAQHAPDHEEGVAALLEGRAPVWKG